MGFPCQNYPKDLDPSCKMDLVLWGCFEIYEDMVQILLMLKEILRLKVEDQGLVVQSIVSLTSSLRGQLKVFYDFITKYTDIFF